MADIERIIREGNYRLLEGKNTVGEVADVLNSSDNSGARREAARVLGLARDPAAISALDKAMNSDSDPAVRQESARSLGMIGTKDAVDRLIRATDSVATDGQTRPAIAEGLGLSGDRRAVPYLTKILDSPGTPKLKEEAARALGRIGDKSASRFLIAALRESDPNVKAAAAEALGILGDKSATGPLIGQLDNRHHIVKRSVIQALGRIGDAKATEALLDILSESNNHPDVRADAVRSLGMIGGSRALEGLRQQLRLEPDGPLKSLMQQMERSIEGGKRPETGRKDSELDQLVPKIPGQGEMNMFTGAPLQQPENSQHETRKGGRKKATI